MWELLGAAVVIAAASGAGGVVLVVGVCVGGENILKKKKSCFELYSFVENSYLHFVLNSLLGPPVSA